MGYNWVLVLLLQLPSYYKDDSCKLPYFFENRIIALDTYQIYCYILSLYNIFISLQLYLILSKFLNYYLFFNILHSRKIHSENYWAWCQSAFAVCYYTKKIETCFDLRRTCFGLFAKMLWEFYTIKLLDEGENKREMFASVSKGHNRQSRYCFCVYNESNMQKNAFSLNTMGC